MPRFTSTLLTTTDQGSVLWNPPLTLSHWVLQQSLTGLPASVLTSLKLNSAQQQWAGSKMPVWSYHCPAHNSPMASQHTPKELNTAHTSTRKFALAYKTCPCLSLRTSSIPALPTLPALVSCWFYPLPPKKSSSSQGASPVSLQELGFPRPYRVHPLTSMHLQKTNKQTNSL